VRDVVHPADGSRPPGSRPPGSRPTGSRPTWWRLASSAPVVRRALAYAVVVGSVLVSINHGDALLRGELDGARLLRIALTVVVPYVVSTLSSVGALRQRG
jgi:hypothetical protein